MSIIAVDNLGVIAKTLKLKYNDMQEVRTFAKGLELYVLGDKPLIVTEMIDVFSPVSFEKFVYTIRKNDVRPYTPIIVYTCNINHDNKEEVVSRLTELEIDAVIQQSSHITITQALIKCINKLRAEPTVFRLQLQVYMELQKKRDYHHLDNNLRFESYLRGKQRRR